MVRRIVAGIALATVVGCAPLSGPQDVVVIARGDDGRYGLYAREVDAADLHALRGELVEMIARPTVVFDAGGGATIEGGGALDVNYAREGDQLVPLDYDGLIAVSAYHHLNQADAYFRDIGLSAGLGPLLALYRPLTDYGGTVGPHEFHDNAAFIPSIGAFSLLEEQWLDYVPLAANEGIMAHEYAHAVFHAIAGGPDPGWDRASVNLWRSVNEGLADVHAVAITSDPAFARSSIGRFVFDRDVSAPAIALTDELLATALEQPYNPYPIGTVFAAAFWDVRVALVELGRDPADASRAMGALGLRALEAVAIEPSGFDLAGFAEAAAGSAGPHRDLLCEALRSRAALIMDGVDACR